MAITNRQLWEDYVLTALPHTSKLLSEDSGVVEIQKEPKFKAGEVVRRIPGLKDFETIAGDDEQVTNTPGMALTPVDGDGWEEYAPILHRGKAIQDKHVQRMNTGLDLIQTYGPQFGKYVSGRIEARFGNILTALFDGTAGALRTTHRTNTPTLNLSVGHFIDAKANFSIVNEDAGESLSVAYANPLVIADAVKNAAATYVNAGDFGVTLFQSGKMAMMGDTVLIPNARLCPTLGSSTYPTYMFGPLALYLGWQKEMEIDQETRLLENGKRYLGQFLYDFCLGVRGMSWDSTVANPSATLLATPAKWVKSGRPDWEIQVYQIVTKIGA